MSTNAKKFFFILYLPIYNLLNRNEVISKCGICLCLEGGNYPAVVLTHFKYLNPLASDAKKWKTICEYFFYCEKKLNTKKKA
jgi:hypothetical protein